MPDDGAAQPLDEQTLSWLRPVAALYPSTDAALARLAYLASVLTLPKGTVHVVSDVHGEFKKLKHVINNASGSLRRVVEQVFGDRWSESEKRDFLNYVYYPRESFDYLGPRIADPSERRRFVHRTTRSALELIRALSCRVSLQSLDAVMPEAHRLIFREMLFEADLSRREIYVGTMLDRMIEHGRDLHFLRLLSHAIRNLLISEIVIAGDLGDRGPRIDKVIEYLRRQPKVSVAWGNHDAVWMGACFGDETCIATVLRNSLRYRRLSQLEEGYGVPVAPLEKLARTVYGDDPAERFPCKGEGLRDALLMARMQKAAAIIQFKLEGQMSLRNPDFEMQSRAVFGEIDPEKGTVAIDGKEHSLLDRRFPTVDWSDPFRLTAEEQAAIARIKESFLFSPVMWEHVQFLTRVGSMYLVRDHNLIFHGCVPVDARGNFVPKRVDGSEYRGKALFDAFDRVVQRALRRKQRRDLDLLYYLWAGRLSPLFGKERMTTFERYLIADESTHKETKNPYFQLIHQREFCEKIFREFGVRPDLGVIVNGHVPVKVESGESPVKESGAAVDIDGAFSEAYGDRGFTLALEAGRTYVAEHHHFESVKSALTEGADIVPAIQEVRTFDPERTIGDTEQGAEIRREISRLELLLRAYRENALIEQGD
jgi:fructose-1,6-bisphosphatase III